MNFRFCEHSTVTSANLPPAKTGRAASQDEQREFSSVFPDIVHDLTDVGKDTDIRDSQKWYAKVGAVVYTNRKLTILLHWVLRGLYER